MRHDHLVAAGDQGDQTICLRTGPVPAWAEFVQILRMFDRLEAKLIFNLVDPIFERLRRLVGSFGLFEPPLAGRQTLLESTCF